jgi:hypothetical protein
MTFALAIEAFCDWLVWTIFGHVTFLVANTASHHTWLSFFFDFIIGALT